MLNKNMITKNTSRKEVLKLGQTCKMCGHCCSMGSGFAQKDEIEKIAKHLKKSVAEIETKYFDKIIMFNKVVHRPKLERKHSDLPFGKCVFLKKDKCSIHEAKPLHCRVGNCNDKGNELSEWYTLNFLVDKENAQSIREWQVRVSLKPTIKGGKPEDLVEDKEKLKRMLDYSIR